MRVSLPLAHAIRAPLIGYRGPQKRVGLPLAHAFCVRK